MAIRVLEIYDSFKPDRLLDVKFEYATTPKFVRSFRSSYASLYELLERVQYNDAKREKKTHNSSI